jgi:hypothetical protein
MYIEYLGAFVEVADAVVSPPPREGSASPSRSSAAGFLGSSKSSVLSFSPGPREVPPEWRAATMARVASICLPTTGTTTLPFPIDRMAPGETTMSNWPQLDYLGWRETCSALHLYLQIAGKYRLAHTPWLNHSWNATFYVTPQGLTSSPIPDGPGIEILFDLREHKVVGTCGNGRKKSFDLEPMTVAKFHASFVQLISELGGTPSFNGQPNEVPNPVPFAEDDRNRPYDRDAVHRYHQALVAIDRVFNRFRTSFLGKSSPVHLFWGALDLAITRFSGRRAPLHPGGIPSLPNDVAQEAYDREVSSSGFWPGGNGIDYPAFYSYAYPAPVGYRIAYVQPEAAFWHEGLSEFMLPYLAVQSAADPDEVLMAFLVSTYEAAAHLGGWDRDLLECPQGAPRQVRRPDADT